MPVKNVCDCPNPPGGSVVCEPHQMAICGVINGVPRRECLDLPSGRTPLELINWVLSQISGEFRTADMAITAGDLRTLTDGTFTKLNGDIVKFVVPERVIRAVNALIALSRMRIPVHSGH